MLHDATSFIGVGLMKPVSSCDMTKNVLPGAFKSPVRLFFFFFRKEQCSFLETCFVKLFQISQSYSRIFQSNGETNFYI